MQITLDQLIAWHAHFSSLAGKSQLVKEIIDAIEKHLHEILTTLKPAQGS